MLGDGASNVANLCAYISSTIKIDRCQSEVKIRVTENMMSSTRVVMRLFQLKFQDVSAKFLCS